MGLTTLRRLGLTIVQGVLKPILKSRIIRYSPGAGGTRKRTWIYVLIRRKSV